MDAVERAAKERRLAMTKQISRDEAERVATLLEGFDVMTEAARERAGTRAAAMLRSLMDELEGARAEKGMAVAGLERQLAEVNDQLAAANERAEKAEKQCAYSWVVIANSFGGDWSKASSEWQDMARACEWPRPAEIEELWRGD